MKILPAILLSGALLVAGVAAGVSGYSLKSGAAAGSDLSTASVRPSASETTRPALSTTTQTACPSAMSGPSKIASLSVSVTLRITVLEARMAAEVRRVSSARDTFSDVQ